jgi:predicted AAA+ superfamily ATPase
MRELVVREIVSQVLDDLSFFPVVGIIGPRQVGKTTIARQVQPFVNSEILYLDLELDSDLAKLSEAESFLKFHQNKCIVIDEVQRMPSLFPLIRALVDIDRRPARFI